MSREMLREKGPIRVVAALLTNAGKGSRGSVNVVEIVVNLRVSDLRGREEEESEDRGSRCNEMGNAARRSLPRGKDREVAHGSETHTTLRAWARR